jgi:hypothetical protein
MKSAFGVVHKSIPGQLPMFTAGLKPVKDALPAKKKILPTRALLRGEMHTIMHSEGQKLRVMNGRGQQRSVTRDQLTFLKGRKK